MFRFSKLKEIIENSKIIHLKDDLIFEKIIPLNQNSEKKTISFIGSKKYLKELENSTSGGFIVSKELESLITKPALVVPNVDFALVKILNYMYPAQEVNQTTIGKYTEIHKSVHIGKNVTIGNFVSIGKNSYIGDFSILEDGVKIGEDVEIKENAKIGFNTSILQNTRIGKNFVAGCNSTFGSDGFRFIFENKKPLKVPQVGKLIIGDNVEIQANCAIDRGGLGDTIIGNNCKLDNLVHIAHNCVLGQNVIITAGCAIAGSTKVGDNVMIGGTSAISDHLEIASNVIIAGGSVIRKSILESGTYAADGSLTIKEFQKYRANLKNVTQLNQWIKKIKEIEQTSK